MTETRTSRFNLPQWSTGTDSPSRTDFTDAFFDLEARAAYDDGTTAGSLPGTNLFAGRYFRQSHSDGYSVYRRSASAWEWVGGNIAPTLVRHRAAAPGDEVLTVDQGGAGSTTVTLYGNGDFATDGTIWSPQVAVGTNGDTLDFADTGRVYIETRATSERGLVLRPHAADAGYMIASKDSGGSIVTSVDALGRLQQRSFAAFGGGANLSAASSVVVAPTAIADANVNGLLLHGHSSGDVGISGKTMLQIWRDAGDTAPIFSAERDRLLIGRLPWGSDTTGGHIRMTARALHLRGMGWPTPDDRALLHVIKVDNADPGNASLEKNVFTVAWDTVSTRVPTYLSNLHTVASPNLTLYNQAPHGGRLMEAYRQTGPSTFEQKVLWDSDGRLATGVPHVSPTTVRDARQPVIHASNKQWAAINDDPNTVGLLLTPNTTTSYTWPVMTVRSNSVTDLDIKTNVETMLFGSTSAESAQLVNLITDLKVGAGAFTELEYLPGSGTTPGTAAGARPGGVNISSAVVGQALPVGTTFQIRTRFYVSTAAVNVRVRKAELRITESLIEYQAGA